MRVTLTGTLADLEEFLQNYKSRIEDVKLECTVLDKPAKEDSGIKEANEIANHVRSDADTKDIFPRYFFGDKTTKTKNQLQSFWSSTFTTDSGKEITGQDGNYFIIDGHLYGKMVDVRKDIGRSDFFIYDHSKRGYIGFEKIKGIKYFSLEDAKSCSEKADKVTKNKKIQKIQKTGKTYSGKPYNVLNDGHINVNGIVYATANALAKQYDIELTYIYGYKAVRREKVGKRIFFNCDDFDKQINRTAKKKVQAQKEIEDQTSDDFKVWKLKLAELCRASKMNAGKVYSGAYKKMNRDYGIVFEQLNKDYYNTNGVHARSTLELVYWLETEYNTRCINMFESIVKDMCSKKVYEV